MTETKISDNDRAGLVALSCQQGDCSETDIIKRCIKNSLRTKSASPNASEYQPVLIDLASLWAEADAEEKQEKEKDKQKAKKYREVHSLYNYYREEEDVEGEEEWRLHCNSGCFTQMCCPKCGDSNSALCECAKQRFMKARKTTKRSKRSASLS